MLAEEASAERFWATELPHLTSTSYETTLVGGSAGGSTTATYRDGSGAVVQTSTVSTTVAATYTIPLVPGTGSELVTDQAHTVEGPYLAAWTFTTNGHPYTNNDGGRLQEEGDLGTEYYVVGHEVDQFDSFIYVIATQDGTSLTVRAGGPIASGPGVPAMVKGSTSTFAMDARDVLRLHSQGTGDDATGTFISSNLPVSVFAGAECPQLSTTCDHIHENVLPLDVAGKTFVVCAINFLFPATSITGTPYDVRERIRVVATQPNTIVTFNGVASLLAAAGDHVDHLTKDDTVIEATEPVMVARFFWKQSVGLQKTPFGDPAMVVHIPVERWDADYPAYVPSGWEDFLVVAAEDSSSSNAVSSGNWHDIPATPYKCGVEPIGDGYHLFSATPRAEMQVFAVVSTSVTGGMIWGSYWYGDLPCNLATGCPTSPCTDLLGICCDLAVDPGSINIGPGSLPCDPCESDPRTCDPCEQSITVEGLPVPAPDVDCDPCDLNPQLCKLCVPGEEDCPCPVGRLCDPCLVSPDICDPCIVEGPTIQASRVEVLRPGGPIHLGLGVLVGAIAAVGAMQWRARRRFKSAVDDATDQP